MLFLFDSLIKPILLYSCQVLLPHTPVFAKFSHSDLEPVNYLQIISRDIHEIFHLRFLKWILGVHRKTSNVGTYGELGRLPLILDALKLTCDYFDRCKTLPENSLVKKAFLEQKRLDLSWYHNIYQIRSKFSNGTSKFNSINVFQNQRTIFVNNLFSALAQSSKLEYYSKVKKDFKIEEYLNCTIFKYRAALTRLRISAHTLEIECGRYGSSSNSLPRDLRLCRYCKEVQNIETVESEEHALFECPLYSKFRSTYLLGYQNQTMNTTKSSDSINTFDNINKTNHYPSDSCSPKMFQLSKFCYKIFKYRKAFLDHLDDYID